MFPLTQCVIFRPFNSQCHALISRFIVGTEGYKGSQNCLRGAMVELYTIIPKVYDRDVTAGLFNLRKHSDTKQRPAVQALQGAAQT